MKNFIDFLNHLSKSCLLKPYLFKGEFNTEPIYIIFFLTKNGKRIKYTHSFDNTVLDDCQKIIFATSNHEIRTLDLARELILRIDKSFLSEEGIIIRNIFKRINND